MWVCSLRIKRGTGRAFSLTLAYCFIQTSEVEEQLNKRLHARADQARMNLEVDVVNNVSPAASPGCAVYMEKNQPG